MVTSFASEKLVSSLLSKCRVWHAKKEAGAGSGVAGQRDGWVYLDLGQFTYAEKGHLPKPEVANLGVWSLFIPKKVVFGN